MKPLKQFKLKCLKEKPLAARGYIACVHMKNIMTNVSL